MISQYAEQRIVKDIENDDVRVQITGYIKKIINTEHFILDDKSGEIKVNTEKIELNYRENDLVNVIGDLILSMNGEKSINVDIIQNMNNLNFNYYRKLYELKKELI